MSLPFPLHIVQKKKKDGFNFSMFENSRELKNLSHLNIPQFPLGSWGIKLISNPLVFSLDTRRVGLKGNLSSSNIL